MRVQRRCQSSLWLYIGRMISQQYELSDGNVQ